MVSSFSPFRETTFISIISNDRSNSSACTTTITGQKDLSNREKVSFLPFFIGLFFENYTGAAAQDQTVTHHVQLEGRLAGRQIKFILIML